MKDKTTLWIIFAIIIWFLAFKRYDISQENKELQTEIETTQEINNNLRETVETNINLTNKQAGSFYNFIDCMQDFKTNEQLYNCIGSYLDQADLEYKKFYDQ